MNTLLCIPTYNGLEYAYKVIESIKTQTVKCNNYIIIDSSSVDNTDNIYLANNFIIHRISQASFNHGRTRQLALSLFPDADIIIYMTQDAVLASQDSIENLLCPFEDEKIGAVCGRQLPRQDDSPIAVHARMFNYPSNSSVRSYDEIKNIGIKAAFLSNSFAAYRRVSLMDVGGFPPDVIFGEDTYVAAKMLESGWKIAYSANATCYHSHDYGMWQEFERYFDIGVFHSREKWFIDILGKPEGEGRRFVVSEINFLMEKSPALIPSALLRTALKYSGYKLGQHECRLPIKLKKMLSMNKGYWKKKQC